MRKTSAFMVAYFFSYGSANAQDAIVSHYEVTKNCHTFAVFFGGFKDASTMEGRALLSNAEKLTGLNLNPRNIVFGMIPISGIRPGEKEPYPIIYSPNGYTICSAAPSYINTTRLYPEAGFMGIATPGDTTFSSTIRRVRKDRSLNLSGSHSPPLAA